MSAASPERLRELHGAVRAAYPPTCRPARHHVPCREVAGYRAALDVLVPLAGPETVVVSLQNGMNPPRIAAAWARSAPSRPSSASPPTGRRPVTSSTGRGEYLDRRDGRPHDPAAHDDPAPHRHAVGAHVTDNILGYLWAKQIDCSLLFAQAVTTERSPTSTATSATSPRSSRWWGKRGRGSGGGRAASGLRRLRSLKMRPRTPAEVEEARAVLDRFADFAAPRQGALGPCASRVRKRPTEVDHMVGWVIDEAASGHPMPLNEHLVQQVHEIEAGGGRAGFTAWTSSRRDANSFTDPRSGRAERRERGRHERTNEVTRRRCSSWPPRRRRRADRLPPARARSAGPGAGGRMSLDPGHLDPRVEAGGRAGRSSRTCSTASCSRRVDEPHPIPRDEVGADLTDRAALAPAQGCQVPQRRGLHRGLGQGLAGAYAAPTSRSPWKNRIGVIREYRIQDPHTIDLVTERPNRPLLRNSTSTMALSPRAFRELGDRFPPNPVGPAP